MFGWFRKRDRVEAQPVDETAGPAADREAAPAAPQLPAAAHEPGRPEIERGEHELAPARPQIVLAAPSERPAMPLSDHPNFAGLELAQEAVEPPRLLNPTAALSDEAREQLTALLTDMFGARGRYRLEWRPDREPGDDAMFSEIMVADLVRRIQNTLGDVAAIEAPAGGSRRELRAGRRATAEAEHQKAIEAFLKPTSDTDELAAIASPEVAPAAAEAERRTA